MRGVGAIRALAGVGLFAFQFAGDAYAADLPVRSLAVAPAPIMTTWEFGVSGYIWASGVKGTVATIPPLPAISVDASFGDIIKNLGFAMMGTAEAKYGRFILFNDVLFTVLKPGGGRSRGNINVSVDIESTSLIGLSVAGYRLVDGPNFIFDVFAGVRGFYMENELSVRAEAGDFSRGQTFGANKAWIDAVGGMRMRYTFDEKWFVNLITFAGGGASKYQWDVYGGAGYMFNRNWAAFLGYRAFKVDYRDGDFIYDVLQHGPLAGIAYRW